MPVTHMEALRQLLKCNLSGVIILHIGNDLLHQFYPDISAVHLFPDRLCPMKAQKIQNFIQPCLDQQFIAHLCPGIASSDISRKPVHLSLPLFIRPDENGKGDPSIFEAVQIFLLDRILPEAVKQFIFKIYGKKGNLFSFLSGKGMQTVRTDKQHIPRLRFITLFVNKDIHLPCCDHQNLHLLVPVAAHLFFKAAVHTDLMHLQREHGISMWHLFLQHGKSIAGHFVLLTGCQSLSIRHPITSFPCEHESG